MSCCSKPACASFLASSKRLCSRRARWPSARSRSSPGSGVDFVFILGHRGRVVDADGGAHLGLDFVRDLRMLLEVFARVVLALADLLAVVGVPGAGLVNQLVGDAELDDLALARDALAVEDVEEGFLERRRDLVLDDLDL